MNPPWSVMLESPIASSGPKPSTSAKPSTIMSTSAATLMSDSQYSVVANTRTLNRLSATTSSSVTRAVTQWGRAGNQ